MRRKKRLCQMENLSHKLRSVAISALSKSTVCFCEFYHRDCARTEPKCTIMVKAIPLTKKEVPDPDDNIPDYGDTKDDIKDAWRLENYEEIERNLRTVIKKRGVHPVDPIAVTLKMHPIPLKDLPPNWLDIKTEGWYGGNNIIETLLKQMFDVMIDENRVTVSRWAMIDVLEDLRNQANLITADLRAQNDRTHGHATIKSALETEVPSSFKFREDGSQRPIVGIRVFHGGPSQAMNEYIYQSHYGFMHCNLAQDGHLHDGVYCWNDIQTALDSFLKKKARNTPRALSVLAFWKDISTIRTAIR